jgi:hypothetical protein
LKLLFTVFDIAFLDLCFLEKKKERKKERTTQEKGGGKLQQSEIRLFV